MPAVGGSCCSRTRRRCTTGAHSWPSGTPPSCRSCCPTMTTPTELDGKVSIGHSCIRIRRSRTSLCTPWPTPYGPSSLVLASSVARAAGTWRWSWARPWPPIAAFLTEMLVATACWRTGAKSLSVRDILNRARALRHRLATVGASGVIAADPGPIGAAWRRCFPAHDPGYGFVEAQIPELSIGVVRERRGLGVGFRLLGAVITQARREKRVAVSLSVEAEDPARCCIDGSASSRSAELVGRRRRCCCWWL